MKSQTFDQSSCNANRPPARRARLPQMLSSLWLALLLLGCSGQAAPIVIEWSTETEVNTAGFNVFRSEQRDGVYTQVNTALIPSSPDPLLGGRYSFSDTQVEVGKTYYYKLEELETTGNRVTYDRIVEATAHPPNFLGLSYPLWAVVLFGLAALIVASTFMQRSASSRA